VTETHATHSEAETTALGCALAARLRAGDVVLLAGPLGAGKTAFVRGLAEGLGAFPDDVASPTFAIVHEYAGTTVMLRHVDLYRLTPAEADDLGLDEMSAGAVMAVEWPDRWRDAPGGAVRVTIDSSGGDDRRVEIWTAPGLSHSTR
jgi:tRNA threonylcarbamoyladenosine biosynthesis protein TsaE